MRVLLSTIGSRGDVQPLVALALELRRLGQEVRLCAPPDFREMIEALGLAVTSVGPELHKMTAAAAAPALSPERLRQLAQDSIAAQFDAVGAAAVGCDVIVAATALQIAARSMAELRGIRYQFVAYCPIVLPSLHHAPPPMPARGPALPPTTDHRELWARDAGRFNETFRENLNVHRAARGLPPVSDVRDHIFGDAPWLAADPTLGPWPDSRETVFQPGAWIAPDDRPLSDELRAFLAAGERPIYFGFGSLRAPPGLAEAMVGAARAHGRRAIVSRGWAGLAPIDGQPDCLAIGEVNQQALFGQVSAVVHHGGAGTTVAAALAGAPQVVVPQMYDQRYWAQRIQDLGIGTAHTPGAPSADSLTAALATSLTPTVATRARTLATAIRRDGARIAAERLLNEAR